MAHSRFQPVGKPRKRNRAVGPWRAVTHIEVLERTYWCTLECGHFKGAKRSIPRQFSAYTKPRLAPHKMRCQICKPAE